MPQESPLNPFRVFILGAGFSRPAGLPLGNELFAEVLKRFRDAFSEPSRLDRDIERFIEYKRLTEGVELTEPKIEMEAFVSFLDIEHALQLNGVGENWSSEGNPSQLIVRRYIAETLFYRQESIPDSVSPLYEEFVKGLQPNDVIITFNYDTILEMYLDRIDKPYRLFPDRLGPLRDLRDHLDDREVVIVKLHGSIDWFDKRYHNESVVNLGEHVLSTDPDWSIFTRSETLGLEPLTDDGRGEDQPLGTIYRMRNVKRFFESWNSGMNTPLIVSPSYSKMLYLNPLRGLWDGVGRFGWLNSSLAVIGYSVPSHDEYLRQVIYSIITLFQDADYAVGDRIKKPLMIVQRPSGEDEKAQLIKAYRFADPAKTTFDWEGFRAELLPEMFRD